ncbi:lipase [Clostridium carboxidivorans P7]|uniref:Alpha/beta hydrolase fold protein n=1 Tax=Clostridium carboxidivorans P7 TaxID=536227 RepID=C6PTC2_9CLOT|nr:alpha/beta hydrolase [Clostridium carboxidivorans]AKN30465.1 lipase [Clostridium carboxidivorans P7]EET87542.1 alpha/beta hydrolase fold protein [Clostridium carboxidivorans P7]EFG86206.1 hydrolase, alpha/beta fold family protein [Clostridium carboxidivorans P7]
MLNNLQGEFNTFDGIKLFYSKDIVDSAKAVVVIVHGLCEHLERYNYFTKKLNDFGYTVYRFDNRGHGKSGGERGYVESFQDFFKDADKVVDMALEENKGLPVFMFGHSMGGFITAGYGMKYKNKLKGQILSGAAITEPHAFKDLKKDNYFEKHPREKSPNALAKFICRDENVVKDYDNDPLVLKETNIKLLGEAFIKGSKWISENVKNYEYPCLILHGEMDRIVKNEASKWMFSNIHSDDKSIKIYPKCYHEILSEKEEKDDVIEDIHKWIEERI